jgi:hypothetical protein
MSTLRVATLAWHPTVNVLAGVSGSASSGANLVDIWDLDQGVISRW